MTMSRHEVAGYLMLGARTARAVGRIAADRLAEGVGRGLPRTAEQLAQPEIVGDLLRNHAPAGSDALPAIRAVRLSGVDFESSNCTNFLIDVEFDVEAKGGERQTHLLPKTLYAKLPCEELGTRAFANAVGFWEVEATFCERIASRVPIRVLRVYAVSQRGSRLVLLLENLHELPGARPFINRDMAAGTTPDRARMCLRTFADLHAALWGGTADQRDTVLFASDREATHHLFGDIRLQLTDGEIVQEEQRACPLNGDVVDAVINQALTDRVEHAERECNVEFGAHTVSRTNQDGVFETEPAQRKRGSERTDSSQDAITERGASEALNLGC